MTVHNYRVWSQRLGDGLGGKPLLCGEVAAVSPGDAIAHFVEWQFGLELAAARIRDGYRSADGVAIGGRFKLVAVRKSPAVAAIISKSQRGGNYEGIA